MTDYLRRSFSTKTNSRAAHDLGPLAGGAVGYLGYGAAKWFEPALNKQRLGNSATAQAEVTSDDALLMFYRTLVVFDRVQRADENRRRRFH